MKYNIITTAQISVADEAELEAELSSMKTYIDGKNGEVKFLIRNIIDEE